MLAYFLACHPYILFYNVFKVLYLLVMYAAFLGVFHVQKQSSLSSMRHFAILYKMIDNISPGKNWAMWWDYIQFLSFACCMSEAPVLHCRSTQVNTFDSAISHQEPEEYIKHHNFYFNVVLLVHDWGQHKQLLQMRSTLLELPYKKRQESASSTRHISIIMNFINNCLPCVPVSFISPQTSRPLC